MLAPTRKHQRVLLGALAVADILTVPFSLYITWYVRTEPLREILPGFSHTVYTYLVTIPFVAILLVSSWWSAGMYSLSDIQTPFSSLTRRIRALFYLAFSIMAVSYLVKIDYSRVMVFFFLAVSIPVNILFRWLFRKLARRIAPVKESPATLIIGSGEFAERVITAMGRLPAPRHRILGVLTESPVDLECIEGIPVIGTADDLSRLSDSRCVDEVFFASGSMSRAEMMRLVNSVNREDIVFMLVTDLFEIASGFQSLDSLSSIPVVEIGPSSTGSFYSGIKRLIDIAVSGVLILLLSPLMLLIWLLLLVAGKGSPVFAQSRIGRNGVPFTLYKFRTMKPETGEYEVSPVGKGDPRITALGRFLRRTSFDELPQLFNVLTGRMSLVGPRPEMDFIVREYNAWQKRRLDVKPGITGLWQIMGRKDLPLHENLEYDFYYMRNRSLMLDFAIMARTVVTVLRGRGAY
ncbi:hypothetical protein CSA37_03220 [Candidatus Fermentibacteria bacterium]|nr:MAG: hypothetical protein CSA37_03220 [Candidatus Fermentibacteria bacterium]